MSGTAVVPYEAIYVGLGLASYFLGAAPFGWLIYKLKTGRDIREIGSGNIGATNVGRELGFRYFALVFVLDVAKGAGPVLGGFWGAAAFPCPTCARTMLAVFCGLLAFLGHIFPVYLRFKGGKGVATGLGVALAMNWQAALVALGVWLAVLLLSRFVAVASIAGGVGLPVANVLTIEAPFAYDQLPITLFMFVAAAFVAVRHIGNLKRIFRGEEPRVWVRSK